MSEQIISNHQQLEAYYQFMKSKLEKEGSIKVNVKSAKKRTLTQNRSLHLYCKYLSEALNDAGYDCMNFFKEGFALPWNERLVKEMIWRPVQTAAIDKGSTADAETKDYTIVYDVINRHLIENKNVFVAWPCEDSLRYAS